MSIIDITIGSGSPHPPSIITTVLPGIIVALVAGIVLFLLNWLREWLTAHLKRRGEAGTLAFSLVTQFDKLIADCTEVMHDPLWTDPGNGFVESTVPSPVVDFPDSFKWEVFPKTLQYRVRSIPNKIYLADRAVQNIYEYGNGAPDFDDAFQEMRYRFAEIGLEATKIIAELSRLYQVPLLDRGDWDPADGFQHQMQRIMDLREKYAAQFPSSPVPKPPVSIDELKARSAKLAIDLDAAFAKIK